MNLEAIWGVEPVLPENKFTISYSQRKRQNVWVTYADEDVAPPHPDIERKMKDPLVVYISSRCIKHRDAFVKELMKYLPVVSLGKCLNNADQYALHPQCFQSPVADLPHPMYQTLKCLKDQYRFTLAIENTLHDDYVTEKLLWTWNSDTVPIYRGAPNSRDYAPGDHSYINTYNFTSARELADYIKHVGNDPKLYAEFFEWRKKEQDAKFREVKRRRWDRSHCQICEYVAEHVGPELWD